MPYVRSFYFVKQPLSAGILYEAKSSLSAGKTDRGSVLAMVKNQFGPFTL